MNTPSKAADGENKGGDRSGARTGRRLLLGGLFALVCSALLPPAIASAIDLVANDDFTLAIAMRLQPRMSYEHVIAPGGEEWRRDFMVRRARFGANGKMHDVQYKLEWKIDGTDQSGATPSASVENAYVQYPLGAGVEVRAGLYDQPFSRDLLTSDSKQLAVDRGAVSAIPSAVGLADNVVGLDLRGKLHEGHVEYIAGLFDNRLISSRLQPVPMVVGRLDFNLGSTKDVFMDAHFGEESWYSFGVNGSFQGSLEDTSGADQGSNEAAGIDGMIDVPLGAGRFLIRGEGNTLSVRAPIGGNSVDTRVWMIGAGYLCMDQKLQPTVRYDQVRLDGGGTTNTTFVGLNYYQDGHHLKLQADVRFDGGNHEAVDGVRLQSQIDF